MIPAEPAVVVESLYKNDPAPMEFASLGEACIFARKWREYAAHVNEAKKNLVYSDWMAPSDESMPESSRMMSQMAIDRVIQAEDEWHRQHLIAGGDPRVADQLWPTEFPIYIRVLSQGEGENRKARREHTKQRRTLSELLLRRGRDT